MFPNPLSGHTARAKSKCQCSCTSYTNFYEDDNRVSMRGEGLDECGPWENLNLIGSEEQGGLQRQQR